MPDSRAMLSRQPVVATAVVFVHGWSGSGVGTWDHFPRALRFMPEARAVDFLFVDYPSTTHTVAFCSDQLRGFLLDLVRDPAEGILNPVASARCGATPSRALVRADSNTYL